MPRYYTTAIGRRSLVIANGSATDHVGMVRVAVENARKSGVEPTEVTVTGLDPDSPPPVIYINDAFK
jgi:hypothetical protein